MRGQLGHPLWFYITMFTLILYGCDGTFNMSCRKAPSLINVVLLNDSDLPWSIDFVKEAVDEAIQTVGQKGKFHTKHSPKIVKKVNRTNKC